MAQVQNKYRTVQTSAATIRFTGAADGSDSSSSDDEAPPPSGHNSGPKDSLQKQESTNVQSGVPSEEVTKEAEIDDDSSSDRGSTGFSPHSEASTDFSPSGRSSNSPPPNIGGFSCNTWPISSKSSVLSAESREETQESARYREQMERMRRERFNPFDRDDHEHQDPFPQLKDTPPPKVEDDVGLSSSDNEIFSKPFQEPHSQSMPEDDHITNALLGITEDHYAQPEGHFGLSTIEELELAIQNCKQLILQTPPRTDRMKNLVGKLVQLRLRYTEAKEGPKEEDPDVKMVVGHQFTCRESKSSKHYCEKCNAVIWGVLQEWYKCKACGFCCHEKCLNLITRTCASVKVKENPSYILSICPEKGLAAQNFRCHECRTQLSYQPGFHEPRHCDYTGFYYCDLCHWNDTMVIPARVLHNWDFEPKKVCRASKQFLRLMPYKAVLRIQDINPMLFSFVEELNEVKKLREEVLIMKKYFLSCKEALKSKLLLQLKDRQHFVESSDMYSFQDLVDVNNDVLLPILARIHSSFAQHIKTDCLVCQGKGFICELCDDAEVLFPFDSIAIVCSRCSTVLHRHCFMRRNQRCPKCIRIDSRTPDLGSSPTNDAALCDAPSQAEAIPAR